MACCPTCGIDRGRVAKFGPLTVTTEPPGAFWNGSLLHSIEPAQIRILLALARTGKASHAQLHMTTSESADIDAVKVQISRLRRQLPRGLTIKNIHGWGYQLEEEKTMTQDTKETTIRSRAIAAAQNIGDTDQAAVLVVAQGDGTMRVTPFAASVTDAIQALALGNVVLAKALNAKPAPVKAAPVGEDEALPVS